jgi:hypothetical protein
VTSGGLVVSLIGQGPRRVSIVRGSTSGPGFVANALDGAPVFDFTGLATERLRTNGNTFTALAAGDIFSVFLLAQFDTAPAGGFRPWDVSNGGSSNSYAQFGSFNGTAHNFRVALTGGAFTDVNSPPDLITVGAGYHLYECDVNAVNARVLRDNAQIATATPAPVTVNTPNRVTIGTLADASAPFDGKIARMLIVRSLTAEQRKMLIGYLDSLYPSVGLL